MSLLPIVTGTHAEARRKRRLAAIMWAQMVGDGMSMRQVARRAGVPSGVVIRTLATACPAFFGARPAEPERPMVVVASGAPGRPWWSVPDEYLLTLAREGRREIDLVWRAGLG